MMVKWMDSVYVYCGHLCIDSREDKMNSWVPLGKPDLVHKQGHEVTYSHYVPVPKLRARYTHK